jgi:hypothetical protein
MKLNSTALIRSTIATVWLVVGMTLLSEVSAPFKSFLVMVGTHHWIGKSILAAIAFVLCYLLFRKSEESQSILKGALFVVGSVVLGGLVIFGFFVLHFFGA